MQSSREKTVVVAGGTANVGFVVVKSLIEAGATVVVPSRFDEKLRDLHDELSQTVGEAKLERLHTIKGDFGDDEGAAELRRRIVEEVGTPDAVLAALGNFVTVPSLLEAGREDLERVLNGYVVSHFMAARTFLPMMENGGTYVFLQGPLAFELHPELGTDLISVATAAQHMLFRSLAGGAESVSVVEVVPHTLIRERETQPGSAVSGEEVGVYLARLLTDTPEELNGESVHLRSPKQLAEMRTKTTN